MEDSTIDLLYQQENRKLVEKLPGGNPGSALFKVYYSVVSNCKLFVDTVAKVVMPTAETIQAATTVLSAPF